jgi:capsular polysaccharide export protein
MIGVFSKGILNIPCLTAFLNSPAVPCTAWRVPSSVSAIAGWGRRPSTAVARRQAKKRGLPFISLEDGFLRSFAAGSAYPPLSMVVDRRGIYYDATQESDIEHMLESGGDLIGNQAEEVALARLLIKRNSLSKYNDFVAESSADSAWGSKTVLVVDQTQGDKSIEFGLAGAHTFEALLQAALTENPDCTILVKTHPEVLQGRKRGYFSDLQSKGRIVVLRDKVNPHSLLEYVSRVYVVTSHLGFEALLAGKPVTCFGMPWYAGWGATDDRQSCARRTARRSTDELFAAAYFHYTRYLNPDTHAAGTIFHAIKWLARQRSMASVGGGRTFAVGYRRWKARNVGPMLAFNGQPPIFVRDPAAAALADLRPEDRLVSWGAEPSTALRSLAEATGASLLRMEDGFMRSVGLGSDFVRPLSLVLDNLGLYFDPRGPSGLENLLNFREFTDEDRVRASAVRAFIVRNGLTKYNVERRDTPCWNTQGKRVIFVPGQVEDDASIRFGCEGINTNVRLLKQARLANPKAFIVYKPHPDVMAKNRTGHVGKGAAEEFADAVETDCSVISCIDAADELHTMTSLSGFDALIRNKPVFVYGRPFYAGWGLTHDHLPMRRRTRRISLDELVAGALLHYPIYWDWTLKGYASCEGVLRQLVMARDARESIGIPTALQRSSRRSLMKAQMWLRAQFRLAG